jgi:hypothetical protein
MSMAQYVDTWETPVRKLGEEVSDIVQEVAGIESTVQLCLVHTALLRTQSACPCY